MSIEDEKLFKKLDEDEKKWLNTISEQTAPTVFGFKVKGFNPFKWILDFADHLLWKSVEEEVLFQQEYERKNKHLKAKKIEKRSMSNPVDLNKSTEDVANDILKMLDE